MIDPVALTSNCLSCISGSLPDLPPYPDFPELPSVSGFPPIPGIPFEFPSVDTPGLPTMLIGSFGALKVGIDYVMDFLPLDPLNLPSPPTIDIFVEGFTLAAPGLPSLPGGNVDLPGITVPVPAVGGFDFPIDFDPSMAMKMTGMMIGLPFLLIKGIVTDMMNLELKIPDLPEIEGLIVDVGLSIDIPELSIKTFSGCMAEQTEGALSTLG